MPIINFKLELYVESSRITEWYDHSELIRDNTQNLDIKSHFSPNHFVKLNLFPSNNFQ